MGRTWMVLLAVAVLAVGGCAAAPLDQPGVPRLRPEVLAVQPHDTGAFTEGFEIADGVLYESSGLAGRSQLRTLDPATGVVERTAPVPSPLFAEGLTVVGPRLWMLTYQDGVALEWDRASLTILRTVPIDSEGWGLCNAGDRLVRSDGTDLLRFHDPATFAEVGSVHVTLDGRPVTELNELECVDGAGVGERVADRPDRRDRSR